jgi:hypothetical protein
VKLGRRDGLGRIGSPEAETVSVTKEPRDVLYFSYPVAVFLVNIATLVEVLGIFHTPVSTLSQFVCHSTFSFHITPLVSPTLGVWGIEQACRPLEATSETSLR